MVQFSGGLFEVSLEKFKDDPDSGAPLDLWSIGKDLEQLILKAKYHYRESDTARVYNEADDDDAIEAIIKSYEEYHLKEIANARVQYLPEVQGDRKNG